MFTALLGSVVRGAVPPFGITTIHDPVPQEQYTSGFVHMSLMSAKESTFARQRAAGAYESSKYETIASLTPCVNGKAAGYSCKNIDLYSFTSHAALGSSTGEGSSSWGWTSPTGREIIIVAQVSYRYPVTVKLDPMYKCLYCICTFAFLWPPCQDSPLFFATFLSYCSNINEKQTDLVDRPMVPRLQRSTLMVPCLTLVACPSKVPTASGVVSI